MRATEIRHAHVFCGAGGGGKGFNRGSARVGSVRARYRCIGGIDSDPAAVADFGTLTGTPATLLDLFDRDQYTAWHDQEPPPGWRPAVPDDIRRAFGNETPHIVFLSPPCKGFSGLLSERQSRSDRYQALNRLALRGIWLTLEAYRDDPPEFLLLENVPRIQTRGRWLLDQIRWLVEAFGYAWSETTHDCGEVGGLGARRPRFLGVGRHRVKVPPYLYEPRTRPLRSVGDVLGRLPLPGDPAAGAMHRIPRLHWKTWVRLAFVPAGKDWRALQDLRVADGHLADYAILPERGYHNGIYGVLPWDETAGVIAGRSGPSNGAYAVADPRRPDGRAEYQQYGVIPWRDTAGTVSGQSAPGGGPYSVADPRLDWHPAGSRNKYRIVPWERTAGVVIGARGPADGAGCVADPRGQGHGGKYKVTRWDGTANVVIAGSTTGQGAFAVSDPRSGLDANRANYTTAGHYGVQAWDRPGRTVPGSARHDAGPWSVADPRIPEGNDTQGLPGSGDRGAYIITALDGTWHRPFTTYELAALQGLVDPGEDLVLHGTSDSKWRERIGNAVPVGAAQAYASVFGQALLNAWSGNLLAISDTPIWVRPVAVATAVETPTC